jgi:hypothetical protein
MSGDWIIDVLTDLKAFAEQEGLVVTAARLDDACLTALAELAGSSVGEAAMAERHESGTRKPTHFPAKGRLA